MCFRSFSSTRYAQIMYTNFVVGLPNNLKKEGAENNGVRLT